MSGTLLLTALLIQTALSAHDDVFIIENRFMRYGVTAEGQNAVLTGLPEGQNVLASPGRACASIQKGGEYYPASKIVMNGTDWHITFGASGAEAVLRPHAEEHFLTMEVISLCGEDVDTLTFVNIPVLEDSPFAACTLALNLKTNVPELPGSMSTLTATAYKRFGFQGAKAAIFAVPRERLRETMQKAVLYSDDIPRSALGGPWALDAPANYGSYLIDIDGKLTEETADAWIQLAQDMGVGQIDFHMGKTMRFGDLVPNLRAYPRGLDSVKAVVEKMHAAGKLAGLHTYAFYIAKDSGWVSPKPDSRLAVARTFTLAKAVDTAADIIPLVEAPDGLSPVTGFQVRNSDTVRLDDELITFSGVRTEPPFALTGCRRGAWGTAAASHETNTRIDHLKECFGLFLPDGESDLFVEVAARTADVFNYCGFDMIYLDALDGSDILAGGEYAWHYAAKFVFELNRRLARPALFEMSTFMHHLWFVRSRMGAWDVPARAPQRFIDIHAAANTESARIFMPSNLGWWGVFGWSPVQPERSFPEDIDYLCTRSIGHNSSLSFLVGFTPEDWIRSSYIRRLGAKIRQYEELRLSGRVPEEVRTAMRIPGNAFELADSPEGQPHIHRMEQARQIVDGDHSSIWTVNNRFSAQMPRIRIEALMSASDYDAPDAVSIGEFTEQSGFSEVSTQSGVTASFSMTLDPGKDGLPCASFIAENTSAEDESAWVQVSKTLSSPGDLSRSALGLWVYGDGQGSVLNIQLKNPPHKNSAFSDHYITVGFTGWRYCLLVEPESDRISHYGWPYSQRQSNGGEGIPPFHEIMGNYHFWVDYSDITELNILLNNLPVGKTVNLALSSVRALPLKATELRNPRITIAGKTLLFPVTLKSGQYLEFKSAADCALYDERGEEIASVTPVGTAPWLVPGENPVHVFWDTLPADAPPPRARITVFTAGDTLALE